MGMKMPLTVAPERGYESFLFSDLVTNLDGLSADIAFLGIPHGAPYSMRDVNNGQSRAPDAIRQVSERSVRALNHYDFDIGGTLFDGRDIRMVDCGNVPGNMHDFTEHAARSQLAVEKILAAGALPLIVGGDHAIPIPVLRAYRDRGPITLIQIDAHIDWREEVNGVANGLSSPIRRASEMDHVDRIFQIGMRAQGSARPADVEAALDYGAQLITAYELHEVGMQAILDRIPNGGYYYLTIDADGLDPAVMPAVAGPAPGGVTFVQARELIHGLVRKGRVVGMDVVEILPELDVNRISLITAARLFVNMIGATVRAGYFR